MVVTVTMATKNVCMSRHWKVELVTYGIHLQPSQIIMHLMPVEPDHSLIYPVCPEIVQHLVLN
jgi:hypothetical protein